MPEESIMTKVLTLLTLSLIAFYGSNADAEKRAYYDRDRLEPTPFIPDQSAIRDVAEHSQMLIASKPVQGSDQSMTIPVAYDVSDRSAVVAGLGVRVHYSSAELRDFSLQNVASANLIGVQGQADVADFDGDPSTDQFVMVAWASIDGSGWKMPAGGSLFEIVAKSGGSTQAKINFSKIGTPEGFNLKAQSLALAFDSGSAVSVGTNQRIEGSQMAVDSFCQGYKGSQRQAQCERNRAR